MGPPLPLNPPEEAVEVAVLHVLEDHDEGFAFGADAVKLDDVFVLQHCQQLGFTLEIQAGAFRHLLQRLPAHGISPALTNTPQPPTSIVTPLLTFTATSIFSCSGRRL